MTELDPQVDQQLQLLVAPTRTAPDWNDVVRRSQPELWRRPLVLVEKGIDAHYAGELQKNYEYVSFARDDYQDAFGSVIRMP